MQLTDLRLLQERRQPLLIHGVAPGCKEKKWVSREEKEKKERERCARWIARLLAQPRRKRDPKQPKKKKIGIFPNFQCGTDKRSEIAQLMPLRGNEGGVQVRGSESSHRLSRHASLEVCACELTHLVVIQG